MKTAEIHQRWLKFFEQREHTIVPSASLISDDPTLLFTVAGMVPFVPYFTGVVPSPYLRITSVQKCIRTLDIDEVGKTARHGTFFQMCGNFSFGDYFKEQAISFAWEFLTTPESAGGLGFQPENLWVTVYEEDHESRDIWIRVSGLSPDRIQGLGKETNYWSTGQPGPAGPCSEIFFDRGSAYGPDGGPATDHDRYVEIWNLVFMQYLRGQSQGKKDFEILGDLPKKNIDTGLGLERVAFIKQGVENMYEIDQVRPVLDQAALLAGVVYGQDHNNDVRLRVVADHVRSALMLMGDGVSVSNEGCGYVLRRLLRRSVRAMRLLGVQQETFQDLFTASYTAMAPAYPELKEGFGRICEAACAEERAFLRTLESGTTILYDAVHETREQGKKDFSGKTAFLLHDTYGFPIDLTVEMVEEAGLVLDQNAFHKLMAEQRDRAKADAKAKKTTTADVSVYSEVRAKGETSFTGYDELETQSYISGILCDGLPVTSLQQGQSAEVFLDATSFYAEAGGQAADKGKIIGAGYELEVFNVNKPVSGLVSHHVRVLSGEVFQDAQAIAQVDARNRVQACQAHTATHLIHAALRQILGTGAHQTGSYNKAGYLRLDFSWAQALSSETRTEIEEVVNTAIGQNFEVITRELLLEEAKKLGAMALFGEKYGNIVRMVEIAGPWSRELCGGTHVGTSAQVGMINLVSESSVGSTNRRVESLVGLDAFREFTAERMIVSTLSQSLKTPKHDLPEKIAQLVSDLKQAQKNITQMKEQALLSRVPHLAAQVVEHKHVSTVCAHVGDIENSDSLRKLVMGTLQTIPRAGVVALAATVNQKCVLVLAANEFARSQGYHAGKMIGVLAPLIEAKGGGKADIAQCAGEYSAGIDACFTKLQEHFI